MNYECLGVVYLKVDMLLIFSILIFRKFFINYKELFLYFRGI